MIDNNQTGILRRTDPENRMIVRGLRTREHSSNGRIDNESDVERRECTKTYYVYCSDFFSWLCELMSLSDLHNVLGFIGVSMKRGNIWGERGYGVSD